MTVVAGYETMPKCWNDQGFQVACGVTSAPTAAAAMATTTAEAANKQPSEVAGAIVASTTSSTLHDNSAPGTNLAMPIWYIVGFIAAAAALL